MDYEINWINEYLSFIDRFTRAIKVNMKEIENYDFLKILV